MYRYGQRAHCNELLEIGRVRVGTLHDFRRSEHKRGVADPTEGKKEVAHVFPSASFTGNDLSRAPKTKDESAMRAYGLFRVAPGASVQFTDVEFRMAHESPDCFVVCGSNECSTRTMAQFEGADACLRIIDVQTFVSVIAQELNKITRVEFAGIAEVKYQARLEEWNGRDWGDHPAWIKESEFALQHEVRAIWRPLAGHAISPAFVVDRRLTDCCLMVDV
jgi:hypothetical protein